MPACGRNWQESEVPRARLPKRTVIIGKAAQELSARVQQAERGGGEHGGAEPPPSKRPRDAAGMPAPVIGVPLPRPVSDEILEMLRAKELAAQKECSRLHALKKKDFLFRNTMEDRFVSLTMAMPASHGTLSARTRPAHRAKQRPSLAQHTKHEPALPPASQAVQHCTMAVTSH